MANESASFKEQQSGSRPQAGRSPTKFEWLFESNNVANQYSEYSPTMNTQYPSSFSPYLASNATADPTARKLKKSM